MGQTITGETFNMRKLINASVMLWLLLILAIASASAQSPQLTTVTGTLYNGDGTTAARGQLLLTRVVKNGVIVTAGTRAITADASGNVSFNVLRGATITLKGNVIIGDSNLSQGESFVVPNAETATIESLAAASSVPSEGLTIKLNGSAQATLFGTLDFGTGFTATESPTGELNLSVSFSAGDLPSGIDATKIGASTVNNTKWGYLANLTSDVQTQLDAKAATSALTSEASTRASADITLQTNITSEASTRASADTTLQTNITAEASARAAADASLQPLDSDLTAIAGLSPANDDLLQRKVGAWTYRTLAQVKADMAIASGDVSGLGTAATRNVAASGNAASGEVVKGDDTRLSDARTPTTHTHTASQVTDFNSAVDARISYPVASVFGRTGAVVAAPNDYTWAQVNKASSSIADITTRSASDLSSGTLPDARFPATLPAASGVNLTALNGSNIASGTVADARIASALIGKTYNGLTVTSSTGSLTIGNGKTATFSNTLTFTGTDGSSVAFGAGGTVGYTGSGLNQFASTTSAQLFGIISNETGSGLVIGNDTPTILTPIIASFTNATHGHTNAAGGGQLSLSAFSSTTGSGAVVGGTSPTISNPTITGTINGVKVYRALLTQSGTDAPTAVVLENSIGAIVWEYSSTGIYTATLSGAFTANKTGLAPVGNLTVPDVSSFALFSRTSANVLTLYTVSVGTFSGASPSDELLNEVLVQIYVYP
jgi:hypothetical protein